MGPPDSDRTLEARTKTTENQEIRQKSWARLSVLGASYFLPSIKNVSVFLFILVLTYCLGFLFGPPKCIHYPAAPFYKFNIYMM